MSSLTPVFASVTNGTARRVLEVLAKLEHAIDGTITTTRKGLAGGLSVATRTISSAIKILEELGIVERLNGHNFVFRWGERRRTTPPPAAKPAPKDTATATQAVGSFADGRVRMGQKPRQPDPSFQAWFWPRVFELAKLEGDNVIQASRVLAEVYADEKADPYAAENGFPMTPKFVEVAWYRMTEGYRERLENERRNAAKSARRMMAPPPRVPEEYHPEVRQNGIAAVLERLPFLRPAPK